MASCLGSFLDYVLDHTPWTLNTRSMNSRAQVKHLSNSIQYPKRNMGWTTFFTDDGHDAAGLMYMKVTV